MRNTRTNTISNRLLACLLCLCLLVSAVNGVGVMSASAAGESPDAAPENAPARGVSGEAGLTAPVIGGAEVYVPEAPADKTGAAWAGSVAEALEMLPEGGTVWLTADVTVDTVALDRAAAVAVKSYGGDRPHRHQVRRGPGDVYPCGRRVFDAGGCDRQRRGRPWPDRHRR